MLRLSLLATYRGELGQAAELAEAGLQTTEQAGQPQTIAALLYACGEAAARTGPGRDGPRTSADAGHGHGQRRPATRLTSCATRRVLGDARPGARRDYRGGGGRLGPLGARVAADGSEDPHHERHRAAGAVEALAAVGELDEAAKLVADDGPASRAARWPKPSVARCRGELAVGRGDLGRGRDRADRRAPAVRPCFAAAADQGPHPPGPRWRAAAAQAARRRTGDPVRGAQPAGRYRRAAVGGPGPSGAGPDQRARSQGQKDLTATERQVAELVVSGRTNKEVAAELFVTVRAVESTLTKAYAKLGVRSRTELAARLGARS